MKIVNIIGAILGVAIMICGIVLFTKSYYKSVSFEGSSSTSATFGADFYTYVSEEIEDVSDNVESVGDTMEIGFNSIGKTFDALCKIVSVTMTAIGLLITLYCLNKIKFGVSSDNYYGPEAIKTHDFIDKLENVHNNRAMEEDYANNQTIDSVNKLERVNAVREPQDETGVDPVKAQVMAEAAEEESQIKTCPQCGTPVEDTKYCQHCGHQLF